MTPLGVKAVSHGKTHSFCTMNKPARGCLWDQFVCTVAGLFCNTADSGLAVLGSPSFIAHKRGLVDFSSHIL